MERKQDKGTHVCFVYGTLKSGYKNNHLLESSTYLGEATTKPLYRLFDCGWYPCMTKGNAESSYAIRGELWEVSDATLKSLDRLEGVPHLYTQEILELEEVTIAGGSKNGDVLVPSREISQAKGYLFARSTSSFKELTEGVWVGRKRA